MAEPMTVEQLNALIKDKLDAALKPILDKLDTKPPDEEEEESNDKTDTAKAIELAESILRTNLKGVIKKEKLDTMKLHDLQIANLLIADINPGGIRNPIEQKDKNDSQTKEGMWGVEIES